MSNPSRYSGYSVSELLKRPATLGLLLIAGLTLGATNPPGLPAVSPSQPFTFAVLGDNRGDDSGDQPRAFLQVLQAVDKAAPAFVLDSGDMIYGHTTDEARVRDQWRRYREAISPLRPPMFHVPGNHDLWDEASARVYRELWGKTYYSFDYANSRFIGLDTETANGHLGEEQRQWLEQQFDSLAQTNVFVFLHRPLFPVDGGIGSSMDKYESERDRVHQLFVKNRKVVRGVFAGHEHMYHFQQHDGVPYYISGGGGAPLYMAPELGGFHHFLLVRVRGDQVDIELHKVGAPVRPLEKARTIQPGELLESWENGLFWYAWDRTTSIELTPEQASEGRHALRLNFDLAQYAWPVLALSPASPLDLSTSSALSLDVFVPNSLTGPLLLTPALQGATKHEAPGIRLKPGWNTTRIDLDGHWLPSAERRQVTGVEWSLSTEGPPTRGYVIFDNLQSFQRATNQRRSPKLLEGWERSILWRLFDETVHAEIVESKKLDEQSGLRLHLNFSECNRPVLFARLNPPWNLAQVKALQLQIECPEALPKDLNLALSLHAKDTDFTSAPFAIHQGSNEEQFELGDPWLPQTARTAVERVAVTILSGETNWSGVIDFKTLRAARESMK